MNRKPILAALGYIVVTFVIAAGWHLVAFKSLYGELGIFTRKEPIIPLGILTIILQGMVMAYLYPRCFNGERPLIDGLKFGLLMGVFLGSYAVFGEAAKHEVSSLSTWLIVESIYYLMQFCIVGIVIGRIYGRRVPSEQR